MIRLPLLFLLLPPLFSGKTKSPQATTASAQADHPAYAADGQFQFPAQYREWIFPTSGVDMSYDPKPATAGHTVFDNVFVNPSA